MSASARMADRVAAYLAERRRNGFGMSISGGQLAAFARFADSRGHSGPITLALASEWALSSQARRPLTAARRIEVLRSFAKFCVRYDEATVIPSRRTFGRSHRRLRPHIYTDAEIARLMDLARKLGGLRGPTCATIFGLIAACGLRISEATQLVRADVNLSQGLLFIRESKFGKSRWVPLHPSVAAALTRYISIRDADPKAAAQSAFFTFDRGRSASSVNVRYAFRQLRRHLGPPRGGHPGLRLHDLRHTFLCRRLEQWYGEGRQIDRHMLALSTYVGHVKVTDTYWYITATPELLALAARRAQQAAGRRP
jgi:integrase